MSIKEQMNEIKKNVSNDMPPEVLFEMNRKYRELENILEYKIDKVFLFN